MRDEPTTTGAGWRRHGLWITAATAASGFAVLWLQGTGSLGQFLAMAALAASFQGVSLLPVSWLRDQERVRWREGLLVFVSILAVGALFGTAIKGLLALAGPTGALDNASLALGSICGAAFGVALLERLLGADRRVAGA